MTVCAVSGAASKRTVAASSDEIAAAAATVLGALGTTGRTASVAEAQAATMLLHTALEADPNVLNDPQVITTPGRRPTSAGMNLVGLGLESRPKESARLDIENVCRLGEWWVDALLHETLTRVPRAWWWDAGRRGLALGVSSPRCARPPTGRSGTRAFRRTGG